MRASSRPAWRRSSYCDELNDACVEVARTPARVHVRDSGGTAGLSVSRSGWTCLLVRLEGVRRRYRSVAAGPGQPPLHGRRLASFLRSSGDGLSVARAPQRSAPGRDADGPAPQQHGTVQCPRCAVAVVADPVVRAARPARLRPPS
ncbi:DUF397 domain-containing protein [Streptomyces sulphureus]|uniref:DUF397 domain-containing protein n=1 Tax=Streptomyces sulphureus TaxID=47758 RepID=UPI000998913A|nr:DUF397 domain-containing protein [Streptomyces sulphureus]